MYIDFKSVSQDCKSSGAGEVWRTSRESVEKVSKSELKEKYSDAIKIENDSEADYEVTRD